MSATWAADAGTRFDRYIGTDGNLTPDGEGFIVTKRGTTERFEVGPESRSPFAWIAAAVRGEAELPFKNTCCVANLAACLAAYESFRTAYHATPGRESIRRI